MKNFLKLAYFAFFALIIGGLFSAYAGVSPVIAVPTVALLGAIGSHYTKMQVLAMVGPDISALTNNFVNFGGKIFAKNVNDWLIDSAIAKYPSVKKPEVLPKLSATGNPRPYTAADSVGDGAVFSDRTLTVYNAKWDYDIDPEQYRNKYLASQDQVPYYQYILDQVAKEFLAALVNSTLYAGTYNSAGTTAAAIATGWGTTLAAEIVATTVTPVTGAPITTVNAVTQAELVADAAPAWMKQREAVMFCSFDTFAKYRTHYRTLNGNGFDRRESGSYMLDGYNIRLQPVSWMGSSSRLLLTVPGNLVLGTDMEGVQVFATARRNIIEVRQMMGVGLQIADLGALVCNDQA